MSEKRIIKVYVAGAYSDDNVLGVLRNIGRGEELSASLFADGYAPFTPWHDKDFVIKNWLKDFPVKMFYDFSMAWLRCSDCILLVPNEEGMVDWQDSKGTLAEIEEAKKLNIPIFETKQELDKWRIEENKK